VKAAVLTLTAVTVAAGTIAAGAVRAPEALRGVDEFRVAQVVVHGAAHLEPAAVLEMSGIGPASSVFDDIEPWRQALLAHPLILEIRIERELPGTIEIFIVETTPLAFVPTPELRPVDARGYVLPVRRNTDPLDLPVILAETRIAALDSVGGRDAARGFTRVADPVTLDMLRLLEAIRRHDPAFEAMISEALPMRDGGVRLTLRQPAGTQVLLGQPLDADRLPAVQMTLAHLGQAAAAASIDARFHDQVVVQPLDQPSRRATPGGAR
jgi:hypothetical protein